ncbi:MAG: putative O-glycosylation ligase, exosortase A system-associated [Pseudohongiellaceae bacterium]
MRDILVTAIVFGLLPLILWRPWIGILAWSWLSYMNPHRQTWGFAYDMPFAMIVGATLLVAMVISKEKYRLHWNGTLALWLCFLAWMSLSTFLAIYPDRAMTLYDTVIKIQIMTLVTLMLITDMSKVRALIWVIVGSIGFYSVKGGLFTLMTGGAFRVYGPADSNISENNAMALATLIVIPLMVYLYRLHHNNRWLRWMLGASILLSAVSVFGSQSRGALIAIAVVAGFFWLKSHNKLVTGTGIVFLAVLTFGFMPASWHERMATITNYEEDASAMSRINAWIYSINIASDRPTGGGFNSWSADTYAVYSPESRTTNIVAHSIYFSVLADHGWPGLIMYLALLFIAWRNLSRVIKQTRYSEAESESESESGFRPALLARMLQVSLVAYLSGGAFLSLAYFDLPWHILVISILLGTLYASEPAVKPAITRHHPRGEPVRYGHE